MKTVIKIKNLDCPNCAAKLEKQLQNTQGVRSCEVVFVSQKIFLDLDDGVLDTVKQIIVNFENVEIVEENEEKTHVLQLENLHCAACALDLQDDLKKIKGVCDAQVDFITQTARVSVSDDAVMQKVVKIINAFENVRVLNGDEFKKTDSKKKEIIQISISLVAFAIAVIFGEVLTGTVWFILSIVFYAAAYLSVGYPVLLSTAKNIVKGKIFDENFLMTVASIGAFCLGETTEGVAVMLLYQIGEFLQSVAVGASRNSISALMDMKSDRAYRKTGEKLEEIDPKYLEVGDIVLVKTGEKIPADSLLLSENATLDTKSLTGESALQEYEKNAELLSGTINVGGAIELKVIRKYDDSAVGKILDLVENASSKKAQSEKFITTFARYYTPIVCLLAVLVCAVAPIIDGVIKTGGFAFINFAYWAKVALTFLVVSCPCALIISVPLTYFCGIGACARKGVLVKGATYLDTLADAKTFVFDKTGTLTCGDFVVKKVSAFVGTEETLLSLVASIEKNSAHPIAKAFENIPLSDVAVSDIIDLAGLGVGAKVDGKIMLVGNKKLMQENGVDIPDVTSEETLIFVAKEGACIGFIEIGDEVKIDAKDVLAALKQAKIDKTVMLTGDRSSRAAKVASEVGIDEVHAALLPDEKYEKLNEYKQKGKVVYVGDGVNDAPVMTVADCAVSMGKLGSAAAVEASDLVLVADKLSALVFGLKVARKTRRIVKQNVAFSIAMKTAFMVLATVGLLPLWLAVFADVGVMLIAVLNALRVNTKFA